MENPPAPAKKTTAAPVLPSAQTPARGVAPTAASVAAADLALKTVDLALARKQVGDFAAARALLQPLADQPVAVPGTEYQLAVLALKTGDGGRAKVHLDRSLSLGQQMAPCYYLRAALAGADGDYQTASSQLHLAAQAEPFAGHYFFYWGEALRRSGQLPEAIAALREALARPGTAGERALYFFKLRLAKVGAARGDPFTAELAERLRDPAPSGDWLLLGAAQNLQRNAFSAAAPLLQRAAGLMPPEAFRTCVEDFAFQDHAGEAEIAPLLAGTGGAGTGSGNATQIDPALAPPTVADPALWRRQSPPVR
jgi:tetratricopeptide (TPR) repeat protein